MPCFHPLTAFRSSTSDSRGKYKISFNPLSPNVCSDLDLKLPCGRCVGCRLERSRQWALRCMHESTLHSDNCFITLTYAPEYLPEDGSLNVKHFQDFMKRFRKYFVHTKIRFYHCGEYGEKTRRPHYHAIIFGLDLPDRRLWKLNNGVPLFTSEILNKIWGKGFCVIGDVTFESAAYVARYIMKKINGDMADAHYTVVDPETGEVIRLKSEYTTMSRRPGIASRWFDKYKSDCFPHDFIVHRGMKMKPPSFYDRLYEIDDPDAFKLLKRRRQALAKKDVDNNSPSRLNVREEVVNSRINRLIRSVVD